MKHLFLVHSTITELVARGVMEHEGLAPEDTLFLCSRGFTPRRADVHHVPIDYSHSPESFPAQWNVARTWRRLRDLDRRIAQWTGGAPYHFYAPQTGQRFMQLLKSHPRCVGFSLIEEGVGSYLTREACDRAHPPVPRTLQDRIGYRGRIGHMHFFDPGHTQAFCVHPKAFPGFANRVVLPDVFKACTCDLDHVECVLVLSGTAFYELAPMAGDLAGLTRALDDLAARGVQQIHYKLHPVLVDWPPAEAFRALFQQHADRFEFIEVAQDVELEGIAAHFPDTTFLISLSSVAVYAAQLGCTVLSYARYVAEADPDYGAWIAGLPEVFLDSVQFLGPR